MKEAAERDRHQLAMMRAAHLLWESRERPNGGMDMDRLLAAILVLGAAYVVVGAPHDVAGNVTIREM
jgi:hypothetical protein